MKVKSFSPSINLIVHVPELIQDENGEWFNKTGEKVLAPETFSPVSSDLEIEPGKWFGVDNMYKSVTYIRFPKDREMEWRARKAKEIVIGLDKTLGPYEKLEIIEAAAALIGSDVETLVSKIQTLKANPNESLVDVINRIKSAS